MYASASTLNVDGMCVFCAMSIIVCGLLIKLARSRCNYCNVLRLDFVFITRPLVLIEQLSMTLVATSYL